MGFVYRTLDAIHKNTPIIRLALGACPYGADVLCDQWAQERHVPVTKYIAQWRRFGNAAGPLRNRFMLEKERPDMLVAFPGGKGTASATRLAMELGIPVFRPSYEEPVKAA